MTRKNGLPARVYLKHSAYYLVTLTGKWVRLCGEKDGLPAMYRALAAIVDADAVRDRMPAVIARWFDEKKADWTPDNAEDQQRIADKMALEFREFTPAQITTPVCARYQKLFREKPRTHNLHRTMLRQVLAFAAIEGLREGHNPADNIQPMKVGKRKRWVRDEEIEALKVAALKAARNGQALVQMIELALLTGQRISDLLKLRWQDVGESGIYVKQKKTGERLLIEWSPALRAAIAACERGDKIGHVLKTQSGRGYQYSGIRSAWVRACARAQIDDLNIHDLRGRAGMDARDADGLESAKDLLGHRSIKMTEDYVDGKAPRRAKPSR